MKVLVIKTNNTLEAKDIKGNLKDMQDIVGGWIEPVYPLHAYEDKLMTRNHCFICDEEGLCKNKPLNIIGTFLYNGLNIGDYASPIAGDIFIVGHDQGEEFISLTDMEIDFYLNRFNKLLGGMKNV